MATPPKPPAKTFSGPTRYVPDARAHFAALRAAAEDYPEAVEQSEGLGWMRRKPYDPSPGHPGYFNAMYAALNTIQAMHLPPHALVVEVGAGPGWLTQILVGLGYRVIAVEPSATMNRLAQERVAGFSAMTGVATEGARFLTATLEEADLSPYLGEVDAVLFHEALHHMIDETTSMERIFGLLRPGGCIAVCGEGRWNPGDRALEAGLDAEMKRFGTLESPFTQPYLRHVLEAAGFTDVVFHHSVNGLFPESGGDRPIAAVANAPASSMNTVLGWRPLPSHLQGIPRLTSDPAQTSAGVELLSSDWQGEELVARVRLRNTGQTYWPRHAPAMAGGVTLALVEEPSPGAPHREAGNRHPLARDLLPGEEIVVEWRFDARGLDHAACRLRLVAEQAFWFPGGLRVPHPQ